MSEIEQDALHDAFEQAFLDCCLAHGHSFDPFILGRLWTEFLTDLQNGFPSLFDDRRAA